MEFRRYAIYHLPEGALGRMGTAWLGWDPRRGSPAARPVVRGLPGEAEALTRAPRPYGFHATLKAPFRLAAGHGPDELLRRAALVCDHLAPFDLALELGAWHGFVALRPRQQPPALLALEQALVTRLDDLRAPLTAEERERRRPETLPETARAHLDHWGYPWVLGLFAYHLTLSGSLEAEAAGQLVRALEPVFAPLIRAPMPVRAVSLLGEDAGGRFHLLGEVPLRG
ncbi:DUF1045 domain-containing protein [Paracoccus yeei]|uniref:DUF1045 domain-containing protein n=1 Tax=Paracoccus yeei TaxID=147645 RepID=UPI003BF7F074